MYTTWQTALKLMVGDIRFPFLLIPMLLTVVEENVVIAIKQLEVFTLMSVNSKVIII